MFKKVMAVLVLAIMGAATIASLTMAASPEAVSDVSKELMCSCGCGLLLNNCGENMNCSQASEAMKVIEEKLDQGMNKEQILDYMIANYSEKVLAAPTKKGFNLTAWITPFALLIIGGIMIYFVVMRWVAKNEVVQEEQKEILKQNVVPEDMKKKMEEELKHFDI